MSALDIGAGSARAQAPQRLRRIGFLATNDPVEVQSAAKRKATSKRTDDGLPVHSFRSLLADLTRDTARFGKTAAFTVLASPTELQRRTLDLLGLKPAR